MAFARCNVLSHEDNDMVKARTDGLNGIDLRTRLNRSRAWLKTSAGCIVVYDLTLVSIMTADMVRMSSGLLCLGLAIGVFCSFFILPLAALVFIGADMLWRTRRWGLAVTAALVSLAVGVVALLFTIVMVSDLFDGSYAGPPENIQFNHFVGSIHVMATSMLACCCTVAGIVALRTLRNGEVRKAFAQVANASTEGLSVGPPRSVKALASLLLGVAGFFVPLVLVIPSIALGIVAIGDINRRPNQLDGKWMATTGIVLSIVQIIVIGGFRAMV
jgi:Domain of unknown function (DUF4190)